MTWVKVGVTAVSVISSVVSSQKAKEAAKIQAGAASSGAGEVRYQFDKIQELLAPYVEAGQGSIGAQQELLGLKGPEAQQAAIKALEESPQMQAMTQQGEEAMLQNAAATGGLRGGNLQAALAQFRPQLLSNLIQQQFQNLGGISTLGQASAAGTGAFGSSAGSQIASLMQQAGAAQAGGQLAQGKGQSGILGQLGGMLGGLFGGSGGGSSSPGIPGPTMGSSFW
jgi:hypothetical protein